MVANGATLLEMTMTKIKCVFPFRAGSTDGNAEQVLRIRRFARVAGVRAAATAMQRQGYTMGQALAALTPKQADDAIRLYNITSR